MSGFLSPKDCCSSSPHSFDVETRSLHHRQRRRTQRLRKAVEVQAEGSSLAARQLVAGSIRRAPEAADPRPDRGPGKCGGIRPLAAGENARLSRGPSTGARVGFSRKAGGLLQWDARPVVVEGELSDAPEEGRCPQGTRLSACFAGARGWDGEADRQPSSRTRELPAARPIWVSPRDERPIVTREGRSDLRSATKR